MTWHAVYEEATGQLVSLATVLPEELRRGLASLELGEDKPDWSTSEWDPKTLGMVPKPPPLPEVDRVDDLLIKVPALSRLDAVELEGFKAEVGKLLGDNRYRDAGEIAAAEATVEAVK